METITSFANRLGITIKSRRVDSNPSMPDFQGDHYRVTLRLKRHSMTIAYSKGYGHKGVEPTVEEVLDCLALDADGHAQAVDFDDWARDYGYDTDSRRAYSIYREIDRQSGKLKALLDDDYEFDNLLYNVER